MFIKYNIGDKVRTRIRYCNDIRKEVEAIITGVQTESKSSSVSYKIEFEPEESDKNQGCAGCEGYVRQEDVISLVVV